MERDELPGALQRVVERELQPGEDIVWVGRPVPLWPMWVQIVISCLGVVIAALGSLLVDRVVTGSLPAHWNGLQSPPWLGIAIGAGIVVLGSFVGFWPIIDTQIKRRSVYLVTNRRAVSRRARLLAPARRRVFDAGDVLGARIEPTLGNREHLILREEVEVGTDDEGNRTERVTADGFFYIHDAQHVLDLMEKVLVHDRLAALDASQGAVKRGG